MGRYTSKYTGAEIDAKLDAAPIIEANPTVPSGVTPTDLTGLKLDSNYYAIPAAPMGTMYSANDLAIGTGSTAGRDGQTNYYATAYGVNAAATGSYSIAIGKQASIGNTASYAIAIGGGPYVNSDYGIAIGGNSASYAGATVVGTDAFAKGNDAVAIGHNAAVSSRAGGSVNQGVALGGYTYVNGYGGVAIGNYSRTSINETISFGGYHSH